MVSNSMPVRDLDTYFPTGASHLRFFANRGANGIDGVTSTALGLSSHFGDVLLIIGDLAFYHDMNGLLAALKFELNAVIVVINNRGGGIFSFLPQYEQLTPDVFETYFGTPLDLDLSHVASLYRAEFRRATNAENLKQCLEDFQHMRGLRILEWIVPSREENRRWHVDTGQSIGEVLSRGES
jgi:2-succinyl-5-enolpyruvyl-6-hydroxy-3-cyclohexene-1-carboxylate synthase